MVWGALGALAVLQIALAILILRKIEIAYTKISGYPWETHRLPFLSIQGLKRFFVST